MKKGYRETKKRKVNVFRVERRESFGGRKKKRGSTQ